MYLTDQNLEELGLYVLGNVPERSSAISAVEELKLGAEGAERIALLGATFLPKSDGQRRFKRLTITEPRKIEGYDVFDDPYAYPGTSVLQNRLDIRDAGILEAFEVEIFTLHAEEPLPHGKFDPAHYCNIHHHLFQDVYEWAGQYRTVRTSKGGNAFCYPEHIAAQMDALFRSIRGGEAFHPFAFERIDRNAFL